MMCVFDVINTVFTVNLLCDLGSAAERDTKNQSLRTRYIHNLQFLDGMPTENNLKTRQRF